MKNKISVFVLLLCTYNAQSQSLKETFEWIKGKLNYFYYYNEFYLESYYQKLDFDYAKKILTIRFEKSQGDQPYSKVVIPMSKLNPEGFTIERTTHYRRNREDGLKKGNEYSLYWLIFKCKDEKECIKIYFTSGVVQFNSKFEMKVSESLYNDYGPDFEKRIKKALKHFVLLCGGKKETF